MTTELIPVLVTGGAGYVGSHVCKALSESGYLPVTLDNLSTGHRWAVKWGPFVEGDVRDTALLSGLISSLGVRGVLHFAAASLVGESFTAPLSYYQNNVAGVFSLIQAMQATGLRPLVFSSSCAVYGEPDKLPMVETLPRLPVNPYGRTKLSAEFALMDAAQAGLIACTSLRYFNAAGADLDGDIGEAHLDETHLIPLAIRAAMDDSYELSILGSDYPTPDGTCLRDYVHVGDLAVAHVKALNRLLQRPCQYDCFNLGAGRPTSVMEIVDAVTRLSERRVKAKICARRPGDPAALFASIEKARKELGWEPQLSDIETIVSSALAWHSGFATDKFEALDSEDQTWSVRVHRGSLSMSPLVALEREVGPQSV